MKLRSALPSTRGHGPLTQILEPNEAGTVVSFEKRAQREAGFRSGTGVSEPRPRGLGRRKPPARGPSCGRRWPCRCGSRVGRLLPVCILGVYWVRSLLGMSPAAGAGCRLWGGKGMPMKNSTGRTLHAASVATLFALIACTPAAPVEESTDAAVTEGAAGSADAQEVTAQKLRSSGERLTVRWLHRRQQLLRPLRPQSGTLRRPQPGDRPRQPRHPLLVRGVRSDRAPHSHAPEFGGPVSVPDARQPGSLDFRRVRSQGRRGQRREYRDSVSRCC